MLKFVHQFIYQYINRFSVEPFMLIFRLAELLVIVVALLIRAAVSGGGVD